MSPVHSTMITVKLNVILVAPPRFAAAPTNAYLAMFVPYTQYNKVVDMFTRLQ